jgi:hypothetical protein
MIVAMSHDQGPPASRRPIPFAGAGDVARAHTPATYPTHGGVDPEELDGQVEETYDRDVVTAEPRPAPRDAGPLAEAPGYPPLCAHGMNSFVDRGYDLALARLRRG